VTAPDPGGARRTGAFGRPAPQPGERAVRRRQAAMTPRPGVPALRVLRGDPAAETWVSRSAALAAAPVALVVMVVAAVVGGGGPALGALGGCALAGVVAAVGLVAQVVAPRVPAARLAVVVACSYLGKLVAVAAGLALARLLPTDDLHWFGIAFVTTFVAGLAVSVPLAARSRVPLGTGADGPSAPGS
jgi:hypothetical protein